MSRCSPEFRLGGKMLTILVGNQKTFLNPKRERKGSERLKNLLSQNFMQRIQM